MNGTTFIKQQIESYSGSYVRFVSFSCYSRPSFIQMYTVFVEKNDGAFYISVLDAVELSN